MMTAIVDVRTLKNLSKEVPMCFIKRPIVIGFRA